MPEKVVGLGEVGDHLPHQPWILVLGGTTREGNRRARRAIRTALEVNTGALWFDGYSERTSEHGVERVPLDVPVPNGRVVIVDYAAKERGHWLNRMVEGVPEALISLVVKVEDMVAVAGDGRVPVVTRMRRAFEKALAFVRKKALRRFSLMFRGRVGWRIVKEDVAFLSKNAPPPKQIIYGDDFALTLGWHAARIWPDARTSMEFEEL
ncbi:MAG: hypothetical protein IH892_11170 [Planctomycetes bacterium]|nr:hypothetical protein [Planctomycetota bacterium]